MSENQNENRPAKRGPGRPKKTLIDDGALRQAPPIPAESFFRIEGVYKMAHPDIAERTDGSAIMMSVLPFLVMKISRDRIAVRFPFGGTEVHRIEDGRIVLGSISYDPAQAFAEYAPGLFQ